MARLIIAFRNEDDDCLIGFPSLEGQIEIMNSYGDAGVVEIDLGDRDDITVAQERWLNINPDVIAYQVSEGDLHNEE